GPCWRRWPTGSSTWPTSASVSRDVSLEGGRPNGRRWCPPVERPGAQADRPSGGAWHHPANRPPLPRPGEGRGEGPRDTSLFAHSGPASTDTSPHPGRCALPCGGEGICGIEFHRVVQTTHFSFGRENSASCIAVIWR